MRRYIILIITILFINSCRNVKNEQEYSPCTYVNPFIGNADNGHTFPGACTPFGLIQASPESGIGSWRYCSGFNLEDDSIIGFAQTHLNGTGVPDLGDILILPFTGDNDKNKFISKYDKETQKAVPGYYSVFLSDYNVQAELTATERTAFHRYTFNGETPARIYLDLQSGLVGSKQAIETRVLDAETYMPDNKTIEGYNKVEAWVNRDIFYSIEFDKPYKIERDMELSDTQKAKRLVLAFDIEEGQSVQIKIGISTVSIDGARLALKTENPAWDFDEIKELAYKKWENILSKVEVTGSDDQKTNFYTSLYHLYIQPNNIADVDGKYRGVNDSVLMSSIGTYYSTLSLWDTYRAAHPLYTILAPERVDGFVHTMLAHHKAQGYLPIWTLWGKENYCMIGNHSIPVIVDAYMKGLINSDAEVAYKAIKESSMLSHKNSNWEVYNKYGYYPYDIILAESVSRTLESSYDDYCVAQMARYLGKEDDYEYFMNRASFYKNLFDPESKLMRGKDSNGKWRDPFNSFLLSHAETAGGDYTEGNAWQYTWHVQHDVGGLIELMGGNEPFISKLDSLFFLESNAQNAGFVSDVTGLIGQYAHGNEPSHHVAYLYNYVGQPHKTQSLIREIFDRFYLPESNGLCGNDDCGQMSAWYIFSAMGFYPVNPCGGEYIIGAPQIDKIVLKLPENKVFTMQAENLSKENKYVKSVSLNGKAIHNYRIYHKDIMSGGTLKFIMTNREEI